MPGVSLLGYPVGATPVRDDRWGTAAESGTFGMDVGVNRVVLSKDKHRGTVAE
ncbi:hypothetical protein [Kocuria sp.]|uniref:hypothetical protein n=1 Tax=Kocuria sp. TaxID=1871328 RepID=UPI0026E027E8|nr:hypothetical protein [Kocuria sp.]MDO5618493.1 hypothetical protein [Kocuria sp.]